MAQLGTPDKSAFEKILTGIGKPGSLSRKAISNTLFDIGTDATNEGILKGKQEYTPRQFIDDIGEKYGIDLEFGEKGNKKLVDKVLNFATEVAVDVVTDPLTLLGTGVAKVAAPIAKGLNLGAKGQKVLQTAMVGGALGAATGDDAGESVFNAALGAATFGVGPKLLRLGGTSFLKNFGDPAMDFAYKSLNPEVFEKAKMGYTEAVKSVKSSMEEFGYMARQIRETDNALGFSTLGPEDSRKLQEVINSSYSSQVAKRNQLERNIFEQRLGIDLGSEFKVNGQLVDPANLKDSGFIQMRRGKKGKIGDRVIVTKYGDDEWAKLVDVNGKGDFKIVAKNKNMNKLMPKDKNSFTMVESFEAFNDTPSIHFGLGNKSGKRAFDFTQKELNQLTRKSNVYVGKLVDEQLAKIGDDVLTENVWNWRKRNRKVMDMHNEHARKLKGDDYIGIEPIDFHTLEVKPKVDMTKGVTYDGIQEGFVKRSSSAPIQQSGLSFQEVNAIEAERFFKNSLSKTEKEAFRIVEGVNHVKAGATEEGLKAFAGTYDKFTNFLKQQHLTFNHSWLVNNFTENTVKAYFTGGTKNAWKTLLAQGNAALRNSSDDMVRDLLRLSDPNGLSKAGIKFENELAEVALDHGAITEGFFKEAFDKDQISKELLMAKVGPEEATKIMMEAANKGNLAKVTEGYSDFLGATVGRTGTLMENASRATTFKHHVGAILDSDELLKSVGFLGDSKKAKAIIKKHGHKQAQEVMPSLKGMYEEASRVTNDTFFDYGNISVFEQKVMKRIFPYWTYFAKSLPQWPELIAKNPERFTNLTKLQTNIGRAPTDRERQGLPDYLLDKAVRITDDGRAVTIPNISLHDVIGMATGEGTAAEKVHPLIKTIKQLATGTDDFGGELYPSRTRSGQKAVYGAGTKYAQLTDAIYKDRKRGNKLYTDSDSFQLLQTLQKNLLPLPAIDTAANIIHKSNSVGSLLDNVSNLGPVKRTEINRKSAAKTRRFRTKQARYARDNERRIARLRGDGLLRSSGRYAPMSYDRPTTRMSMPRTGDKKRMSVEPRNMNQGFRLLRDLGVPTKGAAYLAGNIQQESAWKGQRQWGEVMGDGSARNGGLLSWMARSNNSLRLGKIEGTFGKNISKISNNDQTQYVLEELKQKYPRAHKVFMNPKSTDKELERASFEFIGYGHKGERFKHAKNLLKRR